MKLSKNFFLDEFLRSQTAARNDIDMTPPSHVVENLRWLCRDFLQPIRDAADRPVIVSSGYRPEDLNRLIGGSASSAHMAGRAVDFTIFNFSVYDAAALVSSLGLPFDQLIYEFRSWIHLGISSSPRHELLTASRVGGRVEYDKGLIA